MPAAEYDKRLHAEIGVLRFDPRATCSAPLRPRRHGVGRRAEDWQRDILRPLGSGLLSSGEALRLAVASGYGIGKSALALTASRSNVIYAKKEPFCRVSSLAFPS